VPKIKTRRGAAKRLKRSGSGKLVRRKANKRHILTKKSSKRKRQLRQDTTVHAVDVPRIEKTVPYL
jgi:large subunit ribosomal protein L35